MGVQRQVLGRQEEQGFRQYGVREGLVAANRIESITIL